MPATNPRVMDMVREELAKNPDITNEELFEKAKAIDPEIANLSMRQFNARYPLQVKRVQGRAPDAEAPRGRQRRTGAARSTRAPSSSRRANARLAAAAPIRAAFLEFAEELLAATEKGTAAVVRVVGNVDQYVERVLKAAGKA
ncbi:MAG TPA: hypothetical protein VIL13_02525 [Longimicrobiales bacterium]